MMIRKKARTSPRGGNDGIFSAVSAYARTGYEKSRAVAVFDGDCAIGATYGGLIEDSLSLSRIIRDRGSAALLLHGADAYEVAISLVAASLLGLPVILCSENADPRAIDLMLAEYKSVFAVSDSLEGRSADLSELHAAIKSELSSTDGVFFDRTGETATVSFFSESRLDSYGETELLHLAREFSLMSGIQRGEASLSDVDPSSPDGVVCSLIAPLISGCAATFMREDDSIECAGRYIRPTRLICSPEAAARALSTVTDTESGDIALPVPWKPRRRDISTALEEAAVLARRRRLNARRLMRLGGEVRRVTVIGEVDAPLSDGFADLGIMTESALRADGCPFAGLRRELWSERSWKLPRGMVADICDVGRGGVGRLTLAGRGICIPYGEPTLRGCEPGKFRFDECDGISLVTHLWGYVLQNGNICVKTLKSREKEG